MKKILIFILTLIICCSNITVGAQNSNVTYSGNARQFIFVPGSEYSPTDLFSEFKDVMPGDTLTQKITVKNDADKKLKVKIFIRSLGAHEASSEFLSQLKLKVQKSDDNKMAYMFDADADKTAQLTDWVYLGTLYSGGKVNLDVLLDVPKEMDNSFCGETGYLDWEFMVKEFPAEDGDPQAPQTGDGILLFIWIDVFLCAVAFICLLILKKKNK